MNAWLKSAMTLGSVVAARNAVQAVRDFEFDDALDLIGLARRPSTLERVLPALGLVMVGAAIGAGAALIFAPTSGDELRSRLSDRVDGAKGELANAENRMRDKVKNTVQDVFSGSESMSNRNTHS